MAYILAHRILVTWFSKLKIGETMARRKKNPKITNADRKKNQRHGQRGRKRDLDMAALSLAARRSDRYFDLDDFFRKTTCLSKNTLRSIRNTGRTTIGCATEMAEDLDIDDVRFVLVNEPNEFQEYHPGMELYRRFLLSLFYGDQYDAHEQGPDGLPRGKNIWKSINVIDNPWIADFGLTDAERNEVLRLHCRDGFFIKIADDDYRIKTHDDNQVRRLVRHFQFVTSSTLQESFRFSMSCLRALEFWRADMNVALNAAKKYQGEGLNFRLARRRFFCSFGLELGSICEGVGLALDAADEVWLQCRYLLKITHNGAGEDYYTAIADINTPLLNELIAIEELMKLPTPDINSVETIILQHPPTLEQLISLRKTLLHSLKESGVLTAYDV